MAHKNLTEEHIQFMRWAKSHGVKTNGITPAYIPGRGAGMVATRCIQKGEIMISVPLDIMITIDSIPASFTKQFPSGTSVHGILAAFLTLGNPEALKKWDLWRKIWPSRKDFEESMPLLWPEYLRRSNSRFQAQPLEKPYLLPQSASGIWNTFHTIQRENTLVSQCQNLLSQQETRLQDAWQKVLTVFPNMDWDAFSFHWLILNTRSFYYVKPGHQPPDDWNDAIGLVPFADYFNHADDADTEVVFDGRRYTFTATRQYEKGEEIFMSYGAHSNDFLFVEYGFFLDHNESDVIFLDDIISKELSEREKKQLKLQQGLQDYQITISGVCSRTSTAAYVKYMSTKDLRDYAEGHSMKALDPKKTSDIIHKWVQTYLQECDATLASLQRIGKYRSPNSDGLGDVSREKIATLLRRWQQIQLLCTNALEMIGSANTTLIQ